MTDRQTRTDENRGSHVTCCLFCTDSKMSHGGTGRNLDSVGKGEGAEERWEKCRSRGEGMRGGEKQGGIGSTVSKGSWEKVKERPGEESALWEDTLIHS